MTKLLAPVFFLALLVSGCGSGGAQEAGPVPAAPTATAPAAESGQSEPSAAPTTETTEPPEPEATDLAPKSCAAETGGEEGVYTNLVAVRVGAHNGFDRIVFEFAPPDPNPAGNGGVPHFDIRTAKPPFSEDPSDIPMEGDAFVRIVFQGASGYDFDGNATYDGPRRLTPGFGTLAQVVEGGDFEATMTWILGLSRKTCWQIQQLHDPDRLVIDFHHV
jgi:hypothetical protein